VIASGGASADAPGHTIAAFEAAIQEGADALAVQVRLSSDGHPVVFGHPRLELATNGRGPVGAHTVRELKRLDAGGRTAARFTGQRIQTLQEVLERFRDVVELWVEPCPAGEGGTSLEERVVSTLEIYDALERCGVWSADLETLDRIRSLDPDVRLGVIWPEGAPRPSLAALRSGEVLRVPASSLTRETVEIVQRAGFRCCAETADEPALVDRLVGWRVDALATGRPELVRTRIDRLRSLG
jgi:glycerophosphoryl diester phosphodiesterase